MNGADQLPVPVVKTGDTAADAADEFIVKAVGNGRDLLHGDLLIAVFAHQSYPILQLHIGDVGHIHHHLVHADSAQNGGLVTPDQHMEFSGGKAVYDKKKKGVKLTKDVMDMLTEDDEK